MTAIPTSGSLITAAGRAQFQVRPEMQDIQVTMPAGQAFSVPSHLISQQSDGEYFLNLPLGELQERLRSAAPMNASTAGTAAEELVLPVVAEELAVGRREVETGRVRVTKVVHEQQEEIETLLQRDEVDVERIPVNEYVEATARIEYDDDRVVIPIYEEVVVVEKRLLLKEKLVLTRRQVQDRQVQPVTRRAEEAIVERLPAAGARGDAAV